MDYEAPFREGSGAFETDGNRVEETPRKTNAGPPSRRPVNGYVEDGVGFGDFFLGLVFCTRRKR